MKIELATFTSKGQITVPVAICRKLDLKKGDKVAFIEDANGIRVINSSSLSIEKVREDEHG